MSCFLSSTKPKREEEGKMHKKRFSEILGEHGFSEERINALWGSYRIRLDEEVVQNIARLLAPISREVQAKN